ncbi:hypothetical protein KGM_215769 [Danaus plexippus plexippus]|uniref:Uncharacterized protein n=1 Tax=Danaus plexippus plexippus TaxID=278856 RepID=A0A212ELM0_DANPL|nr:hypothetical protein KGM_215769 [Danaus plexippus plexippus]
MVNGNYVLYGDRPASESQIVSDHVQTRTAERKPKRKSNRTANEVQHTLNLDELDNQTDTVKYENKIKEPKLLRYVPTTEVEENFVTERFETLDAKMNDEPPRRNFTKKPKNPSDGSVNYAYSRSSSSCSSPNGNLPTISEHVEQYGTYRVCSPHSPPRSMSNINCYESKLDKYFSKPRDLKTFTAKGSHPDSLYRVSSDEAAGSDRLMRALRLLRWPLALFTVCVALAAFVYFLMPVNMDSEIDAVNGTFWEESVSEAQSHSAPKISKNLNEERKTRPLGKTPEIDFYDADNGNVNDLGSIVDTMASPNRKLPAPPVFPSHVSLEVQYGNEKADSDKARMSKVLKEPEDESTLKPHITQKPEKPLAIYFKDANSITTSTDAGLIAETFTDAESSNDIAIFLKKQPNKLADQNKLHQTNPSLFNKNDIKTRFVAPEVSEYYARPAANSEVKFTSGHSKFFGISIEDAQNMKSTTQNSLYNTRVSPTLPTWKDRGDATTKKYPINYDAPQCRSTRLSLCRGVLPYDLASAPASIAMTDVTTLLPQIEYLVSTNCSERVRHFACSLLEPECSPPPYSPKLPCYNFCKAIVDSCEGNIPSELQPMFSCNQYSTGNCAPARGPCYQRELACGDGTCVPRDWVCDGTRDCPAGEDEAPCSACDDNEYRCSSGMCITKRWLCDGYADCASGEDERDELCRGRLRNGLLRDRNQKLAGRYDGGGAEDTHEPGEELAGSAPAPSVRKPNRLPVDGRNGENESSKELLMTSDSNSGFRRNFTRRPSPSRLTPYKRLQAMTPLQDKTSSEEEKELLFMETSLRNKTNKTNKTNTTKEPDNKKDSAEDLTLDDLGLFDIEKNKPVEVNMDNKTETHAQRANAQEAAVHKQDSVEEPTHTSVAVRVNQTMKKLDRVIDGASMLRKAAKERQADIMESIESNGTAVDNSEDMAYNSAHASPCPSSELRCVDGRCITLSQLCDGTIDCSDHADEDNCYT